jgi:DNA polymerase IV
VFWLLHVDMDQFIAAVEIRRRPELRGRPVVVGGSGDPTKPRQVVATASYEARAYGVHSGMPVRAAYRRCPDAVFLPSDPAAYEAASAQVMAALRSFGLPVEVWGWDEAFVGAETDDPEALARAMQEAVHAATGLTCAIGIGDNKHTAKVAARFGKPGGVYRLTGEGWMDVMGDRPVGELWGVGPKTAKRLHDLGLETVRDLADAGPGPLLEVFGPRMGPWLPHLARGGGDTHLSTGPWVARSRSKETTYPTDLDGRAEVEPAVRTLARELGQEVVEAGRRVTHVAVKVRYRSFFTPIRVMKLRGGPTSDVEEIERAAVTVLDKFDLDRPVRLLGVRADLQMPASDPAE